MSKRRLFYPLLLILFLIFTFSCGKNTDSEQMLKSIQNKKNADEQISIQDTVIQQEQEKNSSTATMEIQEEKVKLQIVEEFGLPKSVDMSYYSSSLDDGAVKNDLLHTVEFLPLSADRQLDLTVFDPALPGNLVMQLTQVQNWHRQMDGEFTYITGVFKDRITRDEATVVVCLTKTDKLYYIKFRNRYMFSQKPNFKVNEKVIIYTDKKLNQSVTDKTQLDSRYYKVKPGEYLNGILERYRQLCPKDDISVQDVIKAPENAPLRRKMAARVGKYTLWPDDIVYIPTSSCEGLGH